MVRNRKDEVGGLNMEQYKDASLIIDGVDYNFLDEKYIVSAVSHVLSCDSAVGFFSPDFGISPYRTHFSTIKDFVQWRKAHPEFCVKMPSRWRTKLRVSFMLRRAGHE